MQEHERKYKNLKMTFEDIHNMNYEQLNKIKKTDDFNPSDIINDDFDPQATDEADDILKKFYQ